MRRGIFWSLVLGTFFLVLSTSCKNPNVSGGILHFDQKRYERARETLLKAIAQEPNNAEAYFWLGKSYAELDSTEQARSTFEKAKQLAGSTSPELVKEIEDAMAHYWSVRHNDGLTYAKAAQDARVQGKTEEAQKNFRLALNQFKKARVFDPSKEETPRNMGISYFNLGQVDSGLAALKEAQKLAPAGDSRTAQILFDQYRLLADQAAEKGPSDPQSLRNAIKFYGEAEKIKPDDPDLLFSLGVVHYQLAEAESEDKRPDLYRTAVSYFEKTLQYKEDDEEAMYNAASLYLELRECDKGITLAKRALDANPRQGRYYDIVGRLNDCLGKKSERVGGLVFSKALRDGVVVSPEEVKAQLEKLGGTSGALRKYREEGKPEEVRTFEDASGAEYMCWFYWSRGKAFAFTNGDFKYEMDFKPVKGEAGSK